MKFRRTKTKKNKKSDKSNSIDKINMIVTVARLLIPVVVVVVLLYNIRKLAKSDTMKIIQQLLGDTVKTGAATAIGLETMLRKCEGVKGNDPSTEDLQNANLTFWSLISTDCPAGEIFIAYFSWRLFFKPLYDRKSTWEEASAKAKAEEKGEGGEGGEGGKAEGEGEGGKAEGEGEGGKAEGEGKGGKGGEGGKGGKGGGGGEGGKGGGGGEGGGKAAGEAGEAAKSETGALETLFNSLESLQDAGQSGIRAMSFAYSKVFLQVGQDNITKLLELVFWGCRKGRCDLIQKQVFKEVASQASKDLKGLEVGGDAATEAAEAARTFGKEAVELADGLEGAADGSDLLAEVLFKLADLAA